MAREKKQKSKFKKEEPVVKSNRIPRLKLKYQNEVVPALLKTGKYKNPMQVPKITKIVLNCGIREAKDDAKVLDGIVNDIKIIAGQRPVVTRAKKSVASFKIRKNHPVGVKVTLRNKRMYDFLDRLISVVIPRIKDFRGLSPKSFDGRGNFAMGLSDQLVFPEIDYDKIVKMQGMDIVICTTAKNDADSLELLKMMGLPFKEV